MSKNVPMLLGKIQDTERKLYIILHVVVEKAYIYQSNWVALIS